MHSAVLSSEQTLCILLYNHTAGSDVVCHFICIHEEFSESFYTSLSPKNIRVSYLKKKVRKIYLDYL